MSWTDERVSLLKRLWGEGKTAAEIAEKLGGVTRNAVIGKAHRLKLSNRVSPIQQNKKPAAVVKPAEKKIQKPALEQDKNREGIPLISLTPRMCRWPLGDPRDEKFGFCGDAIAEGLPYCDGHARAAYQAAGRTRVLQAEDFEKPAPQADSEDDVQEAKSSTRR